MSALQEDKNKVKVPGDSDQRKLNPSEETTSTADKCDIVRNMETFENEIHNTSPNATNIQG